MSSQISAILTPLVDEAIKGLTTGEPHYWELGSAPHQQLGTVYAITIWMKGAEINSWLSHILLVGNPIEWVENPEVISDQLRVAVEALRSERSKSLGNPAESLLDGLQGVPGA